MQEKNKFYHLTPEQESDLIWASIPLLINVGFLSGIQSPSEFSYGRARKIDSALRKEANNFLSNNPIYVCMIGKNGSLRPTIYDGHHRARRAPKFGVNSLPSLAFNPETLAEIKAVPLKEVIEVLLHDSNQSIDNFYRAYRNKEYKPPRVIHGVESLSELLDRLKKRKNDGEITIASTLVHVTQGV